MTTMTVEQMNAEMHAEDARVASEDAWNDACAWAACFGDAEAVRESECSPEQKRQAREFVAEQCFQRVKFSGGWWFVKHSNPVAVQGFAPRV